MVVSAYDSDFISCWDPARSCPRISVGTVYIYNILRSIFPLRRLLSVKRIIGRDRSGLAGGWGFLGLLQSADISMPLSSRVVHSGRMPRYCRNIIALPKVSTRDGGQARGSTLAQDAPEGPR